MSDILKGRLGFKGEDGLSAYEVAVKNGFTGSEQDWLATLGTTNHFEQDKSIYEVEEAGIDEIPIPNGYVDGSSFLDIYVNGQRLNSDEYSLDLTNNVIELVNELNEIGTIVEMVMVTISTNNLPIVTTINSQSTNVTTPGTLAVYDFVNSSIAGKTDSNRFVTLSGTIPVMDINSTSTITVDYPTGFTKSNTKILSKSVLCNGVYVDTNNLNTALSPVITGTKLTDAGIVLEVSLGSTAVGEQTEYKVFIMKEVV